MYYFGGVLPLISFVVALPVLCARIFFDCQDDANMCLIYAWYARFICALYMSFLHVVCVCVYVCMYA